MDQTLLERWRDAGVPGYLFSNPGQIDLDISELISAIIEHVEARRG